MKLEILILGSVNSKYKNEHEVIKIISDMFTDIMKLEVKKHQEIGK